MNEQRTRLRCNKEIRMPLQDGFLIALAFNGCRCADDSNSFGFGDGTSCLDCRINDTGKRNICYKGLVANDGTHRSAGCNNHFHLILSQKCNVLLGIPQNRFRTAAAVWNTGSISKINNILMR